MSALETVDLPDVEILSVGGPVHGIGSPPEGDHWTQEKLRGLVSAHEALSGELQPSAKIGHATDAPAVGWLENVRINESGDKLLADVKRMPRAFAELVKAGAYRTRSVELSRVTSQRTGRVYEQVVTGLAWLGGKMPAVRTLDDVVALYSDGHDVRRIYSSGGGESAGASSVIDGAIARGALDAGLRDDMVRAYTGAPDAVSAILDRQPGDHAMMIRNRTIGTRPLSDLAEREQIARSYGLALEDVA